jgi:hypothetical protein
MKSRLIHLFQIAFTSTLLVCLGNFNTNAQTTSSASCTADAYVRSSAATTNYGTIDTIPLWVRTTSDYHRYYVNFNIVGLSIPSNAVIYLAEVRMKPTTVGEGGAGTGSFVLQAVTSSWAENTVKWNAQPTTSTVNQVSASSFNGTKRVFDVTTLVQNIVNGSLTNNGFMIRRDSETTTTTRCQYHSKEAATSTNKPELIIQWYIPMSITSATVTHASSGINTNGAVSPTITNGSGSFTYKWFDLATANSWPTEPSTISTSLNLTGKAPGVYGLKVTGTWGDVYYMAFLIGALCEPVNLTFHPGPNFLDDAFIYSLPIHVSTNFGTYSVEQAATWTSSNVWYESRSLMRFRLWFDPVVSPVKADLYLIGSNSVPQERTNDAQLIKVTADWNENTVTYTNQPTSSTSILTDVPPTTSSTENKILDIKNFWTDWSSNNTTNYGLLFKLDSYATQRTRQQYHSSDATTPSQRPYISFQIDQITCDRTSYTTFKRELDAGYVSTFQGKLKIQFTEEYEQVAGKKVPLILYDENKTIKAAINYDGSAVGGNPLLPALTYQFDDNRHLLNLSTYSLTVGKFYILELTKSTGEKEYIRFIYAN